MVVIQVSDNTNGIKADLKRGQGGVPGALTINQHSWIKMARHNET